jgi:hypothetical protein
MKSSNVFVSAALFFFASVQTQAAVQLRLRVEPQSQLPAIAPSLRVEAVNTGSGPAPLPLRVALQVTPPGGRRPFVAYVGLREDAHVTVFWTEAGSSESTVLAPKETRDVSFWAGPESPVWYAADSRLMSPGTYRLQLVADAKLDSLLLENVSRVLDQPGLIDPIVSNEAIYTVETPKGQDAVVWEMIKKLTTPSMWSDALDRVIWAKHPSSRYTAYCLDSPASTDPDTAIAAHVATLNKQPSASWADWHRYGIAQHEVRKMRRFREAQDIDAAVAASDRARVLLAQLATHALSPYLRGEAKQILERDVRTRDELVRFVKIRNGEIKEVVPHVTCVEKTADGKHVFWFGYDNVAKEAMKFPIGPDNKFTPPPFDRGQPTTFSRGLTVLGLRVPSDEPVLIWHLQNYTIKASVRDTETCPPDFQEQYTYKPPQRD